MNFLLPKSPPIECPEHRTWVEGLPCSIAGINGHICYGRIDAHHEKHRGSGGGDEQVSPLCRVAHAIRHDKGKKTFAREYGVNLAEIGAHLWRISPEAERYRDRHPDPSTAERPSIPSTTTGG